jgi:CRP-like cAMP-binding protein
MVSNLLSPAELSGLGPPLPPAAAKALAAIFTVTHLQRGDVICAQGDPDSAEYALLSGRAASTISDASGRSVCTALYAAPTVLSPNLARSQDSTSLAQLEMVSEGRLARASASDLQDLMVADPDIRAWGNTLLRNDLIRRGARDWALATLPAAERLAWFRRGHPGHEAQFPRSLIASYLGMSPVTLSRLRNA